MLFSPRQRASTLIFTLSCLSVSAPLGAPTAAIAAPGVLDGSSALPPAAPYYESRSPVVAQDYTLGPGDRVKIDVFKVPQYSLESQVLVDGTISLSQAGRISVEGLTLDQASALASQRYGRLLRYPTVSVTLLTPRPIRVGVAGEVGRRGSYDLSVGAELNNTAPVQLPTVTRALKVAGGITQSADLRRIQVRRPQPSGSDQVITLNLLEYVRGTRPREDIQLRDGDSLFIPTSDQTSLEESYEIATTSFSGDRIQPLNVTVVGEVYRPGTHTVESSVQVDQAGTPGTPRDALNQTRIYPTISRALQSAGGIKNLADVRNISVKRITQSGATKEFNIDLWKLLREGDQKQDLILQDRDTVIVPTAKALSPEESRTLLTSTFTPNRIRVSVAGEVGAPGVLQVAPNTPLNTAILTAGGFNQKANKKSVQLMRLNPDGTVTKRDIAVNFAQGIDEQKNPLLLNDDVVVVGKSNLGTITEGASTVFNPLGAIVGVFRAIFGGN
jgi:polysaccharide biosynthesis/export protein